MEIEICIALNTHPRSHFILLPLYHLTFTICCTFQFGTLLSARHSLATNPNLLQRGKYTQRDSAREGKKGKSLYPKVSGKVGTNLLHLEAEKQEIFRWESFDKVCIVLR